MFWFHLILTVQLMSVLPSAVQAAYFRSFGDTAVERPKNHSTPYTSKHSTPTRYISKHSTPMRYNSKHSAPLRYNSKHSAPMPYISKCGGSTTTPSIMDEICLPPDNVTELPPKCSEEITVDGTTLVLYRKHGKTLPICSGIHLKSWNVLVAASCVYGQQMQGLKVVVKYYGRGVKPHSKTVDVFGIIFHPLYKPGSKDKNLAVLIVHTKKYWQVREFDLPELHFTTDYINSINLQVNLIIWLTEDCQNYTSKSIRAHVRKNYNVCGSIIKHNMAVTKSWYCLETFYPFTFNKIDIASPMYFYDDKSHRNKVLLGLYLGNIIDPNAEGHLYLSAWSIIHWLRHMRCMHPMPLQYSALTPDCGIRSIHPNEPLIY